jgi:hypothetical protein
MNLWFLVFMLAARPDAMPPQFLGYTDDREACFAAAGKMNFQDEKLREKAAIEVGAGYYCLRVDAPQ